MPSRRSLVDSVLARHQKQNTKSISLAISSQQISGKNSNKVHKMAMKSFSNEVDFKTVGPSSYA